VEPNNKEIRIERAITNLVSKPLEPGTLLKAEIFEELLGISRNSQTFWYLISDIRHALYSHGIYLSGEGFAKTGAFEVWHPRDNQWVVKLAIERAERDLDGKLTLLVNTSLEGFSELEKRRHENMVREASMKLNAMRRATEIDEMLKKKRKPKDLDLIES
jgi:hypothetical protein